MKTPNSLRVASSAVLLLCLAACGGGGGSNSTETIAPLADNSTRETFFAYQKTLAPITPIDPATLQSQLAPVSDTGEPTPVN